MSAKRPSKQAMGMIVLGLAAGLGPWAMGLCGYTSEQHDLVLGPVAPSVAHLGGTDFFGRDLLLRTLLGLRLSLCIGLCAAGMAVGLGTAVGLLCAFFGGVIDAVLMRAVDVLYTLPFLFLAIVLVTLFGREPSLVFVALGLTGWLTPARMVRAFVLAEKQEPYIEALTGLGLSPYRVIVGHLLINSRRVVIAAFGLCVPTMVLEEAFLSFLGLGVPPPTPSLGSLISEGAALMRLYPWMLAVPCTALATLLLLLQSVARKSVPPL